MEFNKFTNWKANWSWNAMFRNWVTNQRHTKPQVRSIITRWRYTLALYCQQRMYNSIRILSRILRTVCPNQLPSLSLTSLAAARPAPFTYHNVTQHTETSSNLQVRGWAHSYGLDTRPGISKEKSSLLWFNITHPRRMGLNSNSMCSFTSCPETSLCSTTPLSWSRS